MDRPLYERINEAERLAREGKPLDEIISETGLSRITAFCTVARVRGSVDDFAGLRRNRKDD